MSLVDFIQKWKLKVFLVSLFFIRIPPFYFFPFIHNAFLTTQSLARILFLTLFLAEIYLFLKGRSRWDKYLANNKFLIGLILIFLFELSLGIFYSLNISQFLMRYKDVYLGILMFLLGVSYSEYLDKIAKVILLGLMFSFFYQAMMLVFPSQFQSLVQTFVYDRHASLVIDNLTRGRLYIETFDEAVFLVLTWWLLKGKGVSNRSFVFILFLLVGFLAFVSNFRSRVLVFAVSAFSYLVYECRIFIQKAKLKVRIQYLLPAALIFLIFFSGTLAELIATRAFGFSFWDRLAFSDVSEDVETVFFRIDQLGESWEMAKANLGFGVGLGNYLDNLSFSKNYSNFTLFGRMATTSGAAEYVHDIFGTFLAEGGFLAFLLFMVIVVTFIANDFKVFKKNNDAVIFLIFSFWGLFVYSLFNPFVPFTLQGMFWFTRGVLLTKL